MVEQYDEVLARKGSSVLTLSVMDDICDLLRQGIPIIEWRDKKPNIPQLSIIYKWLSEVPVFAEAWDMAVEASDVAKAEEIIEIADNPKISASQKRIMVDARLRIMFLRQRARTMKVKIDHTTKGEKMPATTNQSITVLGASDDQLMAIALRGVRKEEKDCDQS